MASATWDSPVGLSKTWWAHLCGTSGHPRAPIWVPILLPGADSSYMYTSHAITQIGPDKSYFLRSPLPARMLILDPTLEMSSSPWILGVTWVLSPTFCATLPFLLSFFPCSRIPRSSAHEEDLQWRWVVYSATYLFIKHLLSTYIPDTILGNATIYLTLVVYTSGWKLDCTFPLF